MSKPCKHVYEQYQPQVSICSLMEQGGKEGQQVAMAFRRKGFSVQPKGVRCPIVPADNFGAGAPWETCSFYEPEDSP